MVRGANPTYILFASGLGWFEDLMNGAAGETDFGVGAFIDLDQDFIILGLDDGAKNSADGLDAVAALECFQHALALLFLTLFAAEQEDIEDQHNGHDHRERAAQEIGPIRFGGGAGGGLGGLCQNLEGDRQVCSLKSAHCPANAPCAADRQAAMCSVIARPRMAPTSTAGRD